MALDSLGRFRVDIEPSGHVNPAVENVCPFSPAADDEDVLSAGLFGTLDRGDRFIGRYQDCWAGHVADTGFRGRGSSGGFTSWILSELLTTNQVDAVVHVKPRAPHDDDPRLFTYAVSRTEEEIWEGAKSHYYPVEMSGVLTHIREHPGRYVVVGVPCFIKAVRLLCTTDPVLRERIHYCVGLFCGHQKSTAFAELFGWQCGIRPRDLQTIDFRRKLDDRPASHYGVTVTGNVNGTPVQQTAAAPDLFGTEWGIGLFKLKACDYCDDVVGETADISVGDAWLAEYIHDSRGTNIVVVRHPALAAIVENGVSSGRLAFHRVSAEKVRDSQSGGFRHRREGLRYRLEKRRRRGEWSPPKRVTASMDGIDATRRAIYDQREALAEHSHRAWQTAKQADDFGVFVSEMTPPIVRYQRLFRDGLPPTSWQRARTFVGRCRRRGARMLTHILARIRT